MIVKDSNKSDWLYVIVSVGLSHVLTAVVLKTSLCFSVDCLILGFHLPTLLVGSVATSCLKKSTITFLRLVIGF